MVEVRRNTTSYRKKQGNPALIVIVAIFLLIVSCWIFNKACGGDGSGEEIRKITAYTSEVQPFISETNRLGEDFRNLWDNVTELNRDDLQEKLSKLIEACRKNANDFIEIEAPEKMVETNYEFLSCLKNRARAVEMYSPAIMNALDEIDIDVTIMTLIECGKLLVASDVMYASFKRSIDGILEEKGITEYDIDNSVWVEDLSILRDEYLRSYLKAARTAPSLEEVRGIAVLSINTVPENRLDANDIFKIKRSETIDIRVIVENQGNVEEKDIPVELTIKSDSSPEPIRRSQSIPELRVEDKVEVVFSGVSVPAQGRVYSLEIKAGPVPNEKILDNNYLSIKFMFE